MKAGRLARVSRRWLPAHANLTVADAGMTQTKERGFTIVELLTVLAILAISLGLAVPRLSNLLLTLRLDRATRTLVRDLLFARSAAQAGGERHLVSFTAQGYSIHRTSTALRSASLPPGVSVDALVSSRVIWFSPSGRSSGGFVRLRAGTRVKTVRVTAASGQTYLLPTDGQ